MEVVSLGQRSMQLYTYVADCVEYRVRSLRERGAGQLQRPFVERLRQICLLGARGCHWKWSFLKYSRAGNTRSCVSKSWRSNIPTLDHVGVGLHTFCCVAKP